VAVDLSDVPSQTVRYVPLNAWFRFRRAVEDTPTILVLLEQEAHAKTCASLVLRLDARPARWSEAAPTHGENLVCYPFARLLKGFPVYTEVVRSRIAPATNTYLEHRFGARNTAGRVKIFENRAMWSDFRG